MIKIKREYTFVTSVTLLVISSVMDRINGPLKITIKNPYAFLQPKVLNTYPFTAVSIILKVIAVWMLVTLMLSVIEKKFTLKIIIVLSTAVLTQLYAIQQLATGLRVTPLEWTLAISYVGIIFFPTALYYFLASIFSNIKHHTKLPTHDTDPSSSPNLSSPKPLKSPKSFEL